MRLTASALIIAAISTIAAAQAQTDTAVPKLVRLSGTLKPAFGRTTPSTESVTLAVYRDETGGAPLWQEIQNVEVDSEGRYSLLMGSTLNEGVPVELFRSGEPRWLGARVNRPGEIEQSRVLMASVPYALKSVDAETLGGKPASAYLLANPTASATNSPTTVASNTPSTNAVKPRANSGTPGFIGVFTNSTDLGNSVMQQANGTIGVGTVPGANASTVPSLDLRTNPFSQIGMAQSTDYLTFFASDQFGPAIYWNPAKDLRFGKGGAGLYNAFGFSEQMRIQSSTGNVGIGTQSPASKLDVAGDVNFTGIVRFKGSPVLQVSLVGASENLSVGRNALNVNSSGTLNTALGDFALASNPSGSSNTAIGASALVNNTTGFGNTAIGVAALEANQTGAGNIGVGMNAGSFVTPSHSNNIHIGNFGSPADAASIHIGTQGTQLSFFVAGVHGVTTNSNDATLVVVDANGQLGTVISSRRFKEDIADMGDSSRGLMDLRPVTFRYKQPYGDGTKPVQYGLIAEEVAEVYPDLVAHSADGQIESVKYQVLDSMLLNEVQKQQAEIHELRERLAKLEARLEAKP